MLTYIHAHIAAYIIIGYYYNDYRYIVIIIVIYVMWTSSIV